MKIFSSHDGRVERNARVFNVSLRFRNGGNYFLVQEITSEYMQGLKHKLPKCQARLLFSVVMPNHLHLAIEITSYESFAKMFQFHNGAFSRFVRNRSKAKLGKGRIFGDGPRYRPIHNMRQFFNCLKYLFDNPVNWNKNPLKRKMKDTSENYNGCTSSEILSGEAKFFNPVALKQYTGFSDLGNLVKLLKLPKKEFAKQVEVILVKREWSDEKDNRVFKIDPSKPWTNSWEFDDICAEEETEKEDQQIPDIEDLKKYVDV